MNEIQKDDFILTRKKITKGEKNEARRKDWSLFKKDVLAISGKHIIKENSKPDPMYSYLPGGENKWFETETNVIMSLHADYCLLLFNKPNYSNPGSYIPFEVVQPKQIENETIYNKVI